ncbi:MAG: DUF3619 family protein [Sideroxydans sp.]|nr:DUF3619 family protein [Sideroxydans sp.]
MNIKLNTRDVGQLIERSATQLDNNILNKLQAARQNALQHQRAASHFYIPNWLGGNVLAHSHLHLPYSRAGNWGLAVLLVAVLFGGSLYWQSLNEHDHAEIDIAILTDDLPVDMYVD